jgi:hypothetical protein
MPGTVVPTSRVVLPRLGAAMTEGQIHRVCVAVGQRFEARSRLFEVRVDLSAVAPADCPPIFFFVIVAAEAGVVRGLTCSVDDVVEIGSPMLVATTIEDESVTSAARELRVAVATIQVDPLFG